MKKSISFVFLILLFINLFNCGTGNGQDAGFTCNEDDASFIGETPVSNGDQWHIKVDGNNTAGCGSIDNPCASLNYLFPTSSWNQALVKAGDSVIIHEGTYPSEPPNQIIPLKGEPGAWVTISGANAYPEWADEEKPVFNSSVTMALFNLECYSGYAQYFVLRNIVFNESGLHAMNITDGEPDCDNAPAHHFVLEGLEMRNGGYACIKMAGVDNFIIRDIVCRDSTNEEWPGIGLDCVGCHDGLVEDSRFIDLGYECFSPSCHTNQWRSSIFHLKGGSRNVIVRDNYIENAYAGALVGQHTGPDFFRPRAGELDADGDVVNYEAKDINYCTNVFVNVSIPITFSNSIRGKFYNNTVYSPIDYGSDYGFSQAVLIRSFWQGTQNNGVTMISSIDGEIKNNIFVFGMPYSTWDGNPYTVYCQDTYNDYGSFGFENNLFYNMDDPSKSEPLWDFYTTLNCQGGQASHLGNISGVLPQWEDTDNYDLRLTSGSPARGKGQDLSSYLENDFNDFDYVSPPSMGAFEYGSISTDDEDDESGSTRAGGCSITSSNSGMILSIYMLIFLSLALLGAVKVKSRHF